MNLRAAIGMTLLVFSVMGHAQQTSTNNTANDENFDLDALVDRVSHSKDLGFLTKISLKQDIDRLLESIRKYHAGTGESSLEHARERYDVMVHKLMVLLQDKDKELARSIDDSREKLWAILSDEKKFSGI